ncbi:eukaryotic aspartyl protease family protein [Cinnamomum micranthum f. kanehirae]|uniref:Eukaryotic aspartyl protease family protein n=1 Tax=Cinnamomum micranthum f. kanehirae TaxID=337451 RepID=A0A443NRF2_9MAGN|nr:eukaryotic aspartyl protease family protein [Cinnamomum micranthum f. kanehirae]
MKIHKKFAYCLVPHVRWKESFYYVNLKKISIGDKIISFPTYLNGIMPNSGTTSTFLPTWAYKTLLTVLKGAIHLDRFQTRLRALNSAMSLERISRFLTGLMNLMVGTNETVFCFAFYRSDPVCIFGNLAQQNIKIGYDLQKKFKPTDCAHQ